MDRARHFGFHRVLEPMRASPQAALRLDMRGPCGPDELEIAVEALHVDAASFRQMRETAHDDEAAIARQIEDIVRTRGKLHNSVTGSGGVLSGAVICAGREFPSPPAIGTRVATLVSLTLTPLQLEAVERVDLADGRVTVRGSAFLFSSSGWSALPTDIDERVALAALDVAGAAPRVRSLVRPGDRVVILGGGGRSGLLASLAAREAGAAEIVAVDCSEIALDRARQLGAATQIVAADARDALALLEAVGAPADLTISCVDVPCVEAAAVYVTSSQGRILFFSMATSAPSAALAAEGIGSSVTLEIGNGWMAGHAAETLEIVRRYPLLRTWFGETD